MSEEHRETSLVRSVPKIDEQDPWTNDALDRSKFAQSLTNLVRDQKSPFVISIHGNWGTGKTFLLTRWQQELRNSGFETIYFNAWEDDFCDDPLTAIIGQISESINYAPYKVVIDNIKDSVVPLLMRIPTGLLNKYTGIDYSAVLTELSQNALSDYSEQHKYKDDLKFYLTRLANTVEQEKGAPLVFIVDELDRCRPTFAIELLERVKHIFNIPNLVFVFGINRDELCVSIKSVYGEINADVYLRRFFDMEFVLSEIEMEEYCEYLLRQYKLSQFFEQRRMGRELFKDVFPVICSCLGLSLRDMEHCIRSIAFIRWQNDSQSALNANLVSVLIILRLCNPGLYHAFGKGNAHAGNVMDFIDEKTKCNRADRAIERILDYVEVHLYRADDTNNCVRDLNELKQNLENDSEGSSDSTDHNEDLTTWSLSKLTQKFDLGRVEELVDLLHQSRIVFPIGVIFNTYRMIELYVPSMRD